MASNYFARSMHTIASIDLEEVQEIVRALVALRAQGATVFVSGNGGSQALAQHLVLHLRNNGIRAYDVTADNAWLTATSNDYEYDQVAERFPYIRLLGCNQQASKPGYAVFVISGSGDSTNVVTALSVAKNFGLRRLALLGFGGGRAKDYAEAAVVLDSTECGPVEDAHLVIVHALNEMLKP